MCHMFVPAESFFQVVACAGRAPQMSQPITLRIFCSYNAVTSQENFNKGDDSVTTSHITNLSLHTLPSQLLRCPVLVLTSLEIPPEYFSLHRLETFHIQFLDLSCGQLVIGSHRSSGLAGFLLLVYTL